MIAILYGFCPRYWQFNKKQKKHTATSADAEPCRCCRAVCYQEKESRDKTVSCQLLSNSDFMFGLTNIHIYTYLVRNISHKMGYVETFTKCEILACVGLLTSWDYNQIKDEFLQPCLMLGHMSPPQAAAGMRQLSGLCWVVTRAGDNGRNANVPIVRRPSHVPTSS